MQADMLASSDYALFQNCVRSVKRGVGLGGVGFGGLREMMGDLVAGGISFCLYPNCDHKTVNGATRKHSGIQTAAWERSIWLLHHWAEGALSKAEWWGGSNKADLTCQINGTSNEDGDEEEKQAVAAAVAASARFWQVPLDVW